MSGNQDGHTPASGASRQANASPPRPVPRAQRISSTAVDNDRPSPRSGITNSAYDNIVDASGDQVTRDAAPAEADAAASNLRPGDMVGEYEITGRLGEGTFGIVYRAIHPVIGKQAAVKVLHHNFSVSPEFVARFIEEARAANKIRHRGIIDIFGFGALRDGRHYYIMELLDGVTLGEYLRVKGPLDAQDALPILRGVARAIDAAHNAGIAHRDLKPDNIFLVMDEDNTPKTKVLDFGIAKLLGERTALIRTDDGTPLGTPHYMSPEQCRGTDVKRATDIYAFGVICYEVLTGCMPFDGATAMDVMMAHVTDTAIAPSLRLPTISPDLDSPLLHMLAKDAAHRPATLTVAVEQLAHASGYAWDNNPRRATSIPPLVRTHSPASAPASSPAGGIVEDSAVSQVSALLVRLSDGAAVLPASRLGLAADSEHAEAPTIVAIRPGAPTRDAATPFSATEPAPVSAQTVSHAKPQGRGTAIYAALALLVIVVIGVGAYYMQSNARDRAAARPIDGEIRTASVAPGSLPSAGLGAATPSSAGPRATAASEVAPGVTTSAGHVGTAAAQREKARTAVALAPLPRTPGTPAPSASAGRATKSAGELPDSPY
jgi:eukaryotic-like serine/threonine-protein kinase